ncbi:hypothetical protein L6452_08133 [Arctium lappa]|uniref:Uncharacterized protein n=1 Tax=Arctium lappa TaxID=4217 RepID=A0ACB9DGQ5_ARCLA|nr:hypothetical protein L6452_08133 [Arctium lappa]
MWESNPVSIHSFGNLDNKLFPFDVCVPSFLLHVFLTNGQRQNSELGTKWEERFFAGVGSRQEKTLHITPAGELAYIKTSKFHDIVLLSGSKVHKYGKSTTGESWDTVVNEETYYEAEPHYEWVDVIGDSTQLLSIQPQEKPPGVYPYLHFRSSPPPPPQDGGPPTMPPRTQ